MDGWGEAEARTWLAMDLLAPVHELWAALEAAPAVQVTADGLLGEHRPVLTEAALAGGVDLERALVVGAALERVGGFADGDLVAAVECALVDEACRLSLLPLVNAAADLLLELEREAAQGAEAVEPVDPACPVDPAGVGVAAPLAGAPQGTSGDDLRTAGRAPGARGSGGAQPTPGERPGVVPEVSAGPQVGVGGGTDARVLRCRPPRGRPARPPASHDACHQRRYGSTVRARGVAPLGTLRGAPRGRTAMAVTGPRRRSRSPPGAARSFPPVGAGPTVVVPASSGALAIRRGRGQGPRSQSRR